VEEVLALKRETGDVIAISDGLNNVGWYALLRGNFDRATASLEEAVAIARELDDTFRISLATCNLGLAAVLKGRYAEAVEQLRETLLLSIRRGDRRCGSEAILGLAAAVAGLGEDELSAELDAIQRVLMADAGIVYDAAMLEQLEPHLSLARTRLGPERVTALEAEVGPPTLELALELLDARQSYMPIEW
jgi:tetratricopeptide (TPR) repeat protein